LPTKFASSTTPHQSASPFTTTVSEPGTVTLSKKKVQYTEILMNQIKRVFTCCVIDPTDSYAYLGTKTGDIVEISLANNLFKRIGPNKKLFSQGINCINLLSNGDLLLGAGDGTLAKVGS